MKKAHIRKRPAAAGLSRYFIPCGPASKRRREVSIEGDSDVAAAVGAVAAAVGASDADKCVGEVSARAKRVDEGKSRGPSKTGARISGRARILFMGKKMTVSNGKQKEAYNALQIAWAKKEKWEDADWELEKNEVLREFRQGITHGGGGRFREGQMVQPLFF